MKSYREDYDIIMTKTLYPKLRENAMYIGLFVTFNRCWDTRQINSLA